MSALPDVCGMNGLIGAGVYTTMPPEIPSHLAGASVVVLALGADAFAAAVRLSRYGANVTLVTAGRFASSLRSMLSSARDIKLMTGTEIACAAGVDRLEAVVFRSISSGRLRASDAAALFVLTDRGARQ